ncbi:MAG: cache domain-containing protein [Thermodesulfobacteriota bacterium]
MNKRVIGVLMGIFFMSALFSGMAFAGAKEDTQALIEKGCDFIQKNGVERAVEAFKGPDFQKGDLYMFVYDFKGNCLVQPVLPQIKGKNLWNLKTPSGKFIIQEQVELAQKGGGWIEYDWMHETKKVLMTKVSYVMPVKGMEAYVGCGFYNE